MTGRAASPSARRRKIGLMVVALTAATIAGAYWYFLPPRLNVILVTLDTTRADHLGIYGYQHGLTAAFDDFAKRGVVFDRAFSPAPLTLPSHTTMLTGRYPPEHGLRVNGVGRLPNEIPLLPDILKKQGYDTGAFISATVLDSQFGLERGFDTYDDDLAHHIATAHFGEHRRDGREVVDVALSWLKQRTSRPFFCWIHLYDAHAPYIPRKDQFGPTFEQRPYDSGIAEESRQFARVIDYLKDRRLDEKTLVIVVGDHGEGLDDHLEFEHGMLVYNTTLHIPLVFVGPRECRPGHRVSNTVSLADLTPTILDVLRIPAPPQISGRSLRPALSGKSISSRPCFGEALLPFEYNRWCPLQTVIADRWKYIQTTRPELYDLDQDPGETTNLAGTATDECQQMRNILEEMQATFVPAAAQNVKLSTKDLAKLQALGYVTGSKFAGDPDPSNTEELTDIKDMLPLLAKFEKARHVSLEGKFDEAIGLLREIISATDKYAVPFVLLGDCLSHEGRTDEAVAAYRAALKQRPDYAKTRLTLGKILSSQGHLEEAATEFREVIKEEPETAPPHFELGQVLVNQQKFEEAVREYREAIQIAPEFVLAHLQLGQLLMRFNRFKEAASCFERAIKFEPDSADAQANLMFVCVQMGDFAKAIGYGQKAVALNPTSFDTRFNLGLLLTTQRRYEEGIAQLREAQMLRPDDPRPRQQIQQAEAARKQAGN